MKSIKHTVYRNNQVTSYGLGSFSRGSDKSSGSSAKGQTNPQGLQPNFGFEKTETNHTKYLVTRCLRMVPN